jgi:hypothetical protein
MPHEFDDLIADLNAAKVNLARSVKRCRKVIGTNRNAIPPDEEKSAFDWPHEEPPRGDH